MQTLTPPPLPPAAAPPAAAPPALRAIAPASCRRLLGQEPPILLVDRVEAYDPAARSLVAVVNVSQNCPFLDGHFPDFPIFPGVLMVEALAQASMLLSNLLRLEAEGYAPDELPGLLRHYEPPASVLAASRVKHIKPAFPGDRIRLETRMKGAPGATADFRVHAYLQGSDSLAQGRLTIARTRAELRG